MFRRKYIYVPLVILAVVTLAAYFVNHRTGWYPKSSDTSASAIKNTQDPNYRIVFLGASPTIKIAFNGFEKAFKGYLGANEKEVEYMELDIPTSPVNLVNAADHIAKSNASLIVTGQSEIGVLLKKITTIPIIVVLASDPVGAGLMPSEEGSGNNAAYIDTGNHSNTGRRLEFFLESMPNARNILVLRGDASLLSESDKGFAVLADTARKHGITLIDKRFKSRQELNKFFIEYDFSQVDAIFRYPGMFISANIDLFFAFREKIKKPIIIAIKKIQKGLKKRLRQ